MVSYIFSFEFGETKVGMFLDDFGEYRVEVVKPGGNILVGALANREDATWLFNREVQKLTREWELTLDT